MKRLVGIGLGLGIGLSGASAQSVSVTDYALPDGLGFGLVSTAGYDYYTGPIVLETTSGSLTVYCGDMQHTIQPHQTYTYQYGLLTENGLGISLSEAVSNEIGQIAAIGLASASPVVETAAQAAIWTLEGYGPTVFYFAPIQLAYESLLGASYPNDGWAQALIPEGEGWPQNPGASQEMIVGPGSAVPEVSTWGLMALGFAGLGLAGLGRKPARNLC